MKTSELIELFRKRIAEGGNVIVRWEGTSRGITLDVDWKDIMAKYLAHVENAIEGDARAAIRRCLRESQILTIEEKKALQELQEEVNVRGTELGYKEPRILPDTGIPENDAALLMSGSTDPWYCLYMIGAVAQATLYDDRYTRDIILEMVETILGSRSA